MSDACARARAPGGAGRIRNAEVDSLSILGRVGIPILRILKYTARYVNKLVQYIYMLLVYRAAVLTRLLAGASVWVYLRT